jgi:eukaryotic-like serine/threonine-protein kinase
MLSPELQDPMPGTRYRVIARLGVGSMGEVFLVEHATLGRKFVAKVLHAHHARADDYVARLRREARTLGQIRHPNIVAVTDFDVAENGRPFFVMEYLQGQTLSDELKQRGRLPGPVAFAYARQLLSALAVAHSKGIVHRDVKPQNLFLHAQGEAQPVLKVFDFGAARDTQGFASATIPLATSTGTVVGSIGYLSPEAADGQRVDHRADLYAVGLVLVVMLSGRLPKSRAGSKPGTQLVDSDLRLPNEVAARIAPVIQKALALDPDVRFQSADEFAAALPEAY